MENTVEISTTFGSTLEVPLIQEDGRAHSCLMVDGVRYHFERITKSDLQTRYTLDDDPDYLPQTDANGHCYILAPYSE